MMISISGKKIKYFIKPNVTIMSRIEGYIVSSSRKPYQAYL